MSFSPITYYVSFNYENMLDFAALTRFTLMIHFALLIMWAGIVFAFTNVSRSAVILLCFVFGHGYMGNKLQV